MRKKPHQLQWLETMSQRTKLDTAQLSELQKLQRGFTGEQDMDRLIETILGKNVDCLEDLTLEYQNSVVQIDKLLVIGSTLYLIDMKFYRGHYIFKNNEWYLGEKVLTSNNFEQLSRALRIIQNILRDHQTKLNVKGVLAFMNPESSLMVKDSIKETVLNFADIPTWLVQLRQNIMENSIPNWKEIIQNYAINPYKTKRTFPQEKINLLQRGIRCKHCHQFLTKENKHTISCSCGHIEAKETAFSRTICEYGVIFHDHNLKRIPLRIFFGQNLNQRYLDYILERHFHRITNGKTREGYYNKGIIFDYWFAEEKAYFEHLTVRKEWKNASVTKKRETSKK